jgi:hypothetical protein
VTRPVREVQPPIRRYNRVGETRPTLFVGGSIEMGTAENWQERLIGEIGSSFGLLYNPRRADWDASWEQSISNPHFNAQVNWELDMIAEADMVCFYFDPATKAPITLMELGIASATKDAVFVGCPEGFWRKGNVDILCERANIPVYEDLDRLIGALRHTGAVRHAAAR